MEEKHTQGKWELTKNNSIRSGQSLIAQICSANNNDEETTANAKLIASASELLEALQQLLASYKMCVKKSDKSEFVIEAERVIKQATK